MNPMDSRPRRSHRQLYLGTLFIVLAFVAAIFRTCTAPPASSTPEYEQLPELIGFTADDAEQHLGSPTIRMTFEPGEDPNPLRLQVINRLETAGEGMPDEILEMAWFEDGVVTTLWFTSQPTSSEEFEWRAIDSVRYRRAVTDGQPD